MKIKLSLLTLLAISSLKAMTLQEAVIQGIETNPEILAELTHYAGKKISVSAAKSGYYPRIDLTAGLGKEHNDNPARKSTTYNRKELTLRLKQPLFDGFKTANNILISKTEKKTTWYKLQILSENKSLKIIKAYLDVLKAQKIIDLAEINLQTSNDILVSIKQRYKQGVSDKADLIQIKGRVESAKTDYHAAKNNALDAKALFMQVVGVEADNLENIDTNEVIIPASLDEVLLKAMEVNPAILSTEQDMKLIKYQRDVTNSVNYPQLFGNLMADYKNDADGTPGTQKTYQAMLKVEWNIFNGFKDKHQNEIAMKEVLKVSQQAQHTQRQLKLEAILSWNAHTSLEDQLLPLHKHVSYAEEAKKLYHEQYNVGRCSFIDVLNAQVEVFNAQKALATAQYDEIVAKYRILNSMGTLNSTLEVKIKE